MKAYLWHQAAELPDRDEEDEGEPCLLYCRAHNTVFPSDEHCDLCDRDGCPAGEYELWELHTGVYPPKEKQ